MRDTPKTEYAAKCVKKHRWRILRSQIRHQGLWLWLLRRWRFR